jgi:hypothetical protein
VVARWSPWLILLWLPACGGRARPAESADAAVTDAARTADAAGDGAPSAAEFASAYCALLAPCCSDLARCREAVEAMSPYRSTLAPACLETLRLVAGAPDFCSAGFAGIVPACQMVFAAKVASERLGQPCTSTADCLLSPQGPVRCAGENGAGHCQVLLPGDEGFGPCVATVGGPVTVPAGEQASTSMFGYLCNVGRRLWCDEVTGKCQRAKEPGAACTSFGECGPTAYCDDATGKCTARKMLGAACAVDEECPSTVCGEDNKCAGPPAVDPAITQLCARLP